MTEKWNSAEDVARHFHTLAKGSDIEALGREIDRYIRESHPDKTGGDFESKEAKNRFHELQEASQFLENLTARSTALIPVSQVATLLQVLLQQQGRLSSPPANYEAQRVESYLRRGLRRRILIPKFTSGVFLTVATALFAFMGTLTNHPMLGEFAANPLARLALISAWLVSGTLFVTYWWREHLVERRVEYLMSEECLIETFDSLCTSATWASDEDGGTFTAHHFAEKLARDDTYAQSWLQRLFWGRRDLDIGPAIEVAKTHVATLLERGAVKRLLEPDVSPQFEINPDILARYKKKYEAYKKRQMEKAEKPSA